MYFAYRLHTHYQARFWLQLDPAFLRHPLCLILSCSSLEF